MRLGAAFGAVWFALTRDDVAAIVAGAAFGVFQTLRTRSVLGYLGLHRRSDGEG